MFTNIHIGEGVSQSIYPKKHINQSLNFILSFINKILINPEFSRYFTYTVAPALQGRQWYGYI